MNDDTRDWPTSVWTKWPLAALAAGCVTSFAVAPGAVGVLGAALFALTLAVAIVDWRELIIPGWMNAAIFALGLAQAATWAEDGARGAALTQALAHGMALGGVLLLVKLIYARARGREGLGLGDVKLAGAGGVWLGWSSLPVAIEIAALSALAVFLVAPRLAGRPAQWNERLPFGSFLAPAIWTTWLIQTLFAA